MASPLAVTGTNNADRQVSVTAWNELVASVPVTVAMYGAVGDGTADDTAAIQAALDAVGNAGGGIVALTPGASYKVTSLTVSDGNVRIDGRGAMLTSESTSSAATLSITSDNVTINGIHFMLTGGDANPWHVDVTGSYCTIEDCLFEKTEGTGGYQGYFRVGADNLRYVNNTSKGSNGFYLEASNVLIAHSKFIARATGGDDGIAIKSFNGVVHSIRIEGNHFENHSDCVAIGSEIGTPGAADATHSKGVRGVVVTGNTAKACGYGLFIKPGSNASADYRDGFVDDVVFSNNIMEDVSGVAFSNLVFILASRGAIVSNIRGDNNMFRGRAVADEATGYRSGVLIQTADSATGGTPSVSNIDIGVAVFDPYDGQAFGTSGVPAYPIVNMAHVRDDTAAGSAISKVNLRINGNGCSGYAGRLAAVANAVTFEKINVTNAVSGGIDSAVAYTLGDFAFTTSGTVLHGTGVVTPRVSAQIAAAVLGDIAIGGTATFRHGDDSGAGLSIWQQFFGYNGSESYRHGFKSRHNGGVLGGNALDLYLHKGDTASAGDAPAKKIATFDASAGLQVFGAFTLSPAASATPANNGEMTFELTSNTSLKVKVKGSDGTVRSATLTLS